MHFFKYLPLLLLAPLVGCEKPAKPAEKAEICDTTSTDRLSVNEVWMKAPRDGQKMTAIYATICNTSQDDELVSVTFSAAPTVEIHETSTNDAGVAAMRKINALPVPAEQTTALAPGGAHLMVFGLSDGFDPTRSTVTLTFEKAGEMTVPVEIREGTGEHHGHH